MPDRHDPNLSMRPPGERKPEQKAERPKNDDPLVELARVVSNRPGPMGSSAVRAEGPTGAAIPSAAGPSAAQLPSETDLARDLEEELLNELQASFSMVPEVAGYSTKKAPETPSVVADEPSGETEVPQTKERAEPTDQPTPVHPDKVAKPAPEASVRQRVEEPELSFRPPESTPVEQVQPDEILNDDILNLGPEFNVGLEPPTEPHPQQAPATPVAGPRPSQPQQVSTDVIPRQGAARIKPPSSAPTKRESLASRIARAAQNGSGEQLAPPRSRAPAAMPRPAPAPQRPATVRTGGERQRRQESAEFRPAAAGQRSVQPVVRPPRQAESRWGPLESEGQPNFDPSRFAPVIGDSPEPRDQGVARDPDIPAEDLFFASDDESFFDGTAPTDQQFEAVPGYVDDDLLAYPEEDLAALHRRRPWRGPLAIAALLAVLVVGGVAAIMLRPGGASGPPPIIAADASPTKITPENVGASEGDSQSKLIYDRVDPNSEIADSKLVVAGNDPIADIPALPEDTGSGDVSRVILGGGPAIDGPAEESGSADGGSAPVDGGTTVASNAPEPSQIGPKKVRTVVVRPDGTIVSSEAVTPEEEQAAPRDDSSGTLAELPPASETPPAPAADQNPLLSNDFASEVVDNPVADFAEPNNPSENSASIPDIPPPSPRPPPPAGRPAPSTPTVVATPGSSDGPIDLTPGNSARPSPSGGLGGGFLVQVSSQRSEATALQTFSELQRRYPSILGDRAPNIQRADLGERGVYYRVRVGYPTREQAVRMCENLKAAGGDCLLATR